MVEPVNGNAELPTRGKVFVIGLSKTGTTTFKHMLGALGYNVCGPRKSVLAEVRAGRPEAIDPVVAEYDAFEDWPWPLTYERTWETLNGSAKYILTLRESPETWFQSVLNHGRGTSPFKSMKRSYGVYRPFGRKAEMIAEYERHNEKARRFFADKPGAFLEFCLENGDGWEKLCGFLGQPVPDLPVPHRNRTVDQRRAFNRIVNRAMEPVLTAAAQIGGHR